MTWLSNATVDHLRSVGEEPDLSGTKYTLTGPLGSGGMGTVYVATDRDLGRDVALKVLNVPEVAADAAARLLQEARILAALEHPGIVPVHDVGTSIDGRVFYVMKLVRGQRLDEQFAGGSSLSARLRVFDRICEAVAFAHAHGVIHRDLKPANVMVGPFGEVLVMDWGVAKLLTDVRDRGEPLAAGGHAAAGEGVTRAGAILGTPGYMAPEQEAGQSGRVDERADVYALGALLFFLIAGRSPEPGGVPASGFHQGTPIQPFRDVQCPAPLRSICAKALGADPDLRYARVQDLADEVTRFENGLRVLAYPESLLEKAGRFVHRHRVPGLLILAYIVMRAVLLWIGGM